MILQIATLFAAAVDPATVKQFEDWQARFGRVAAAEFDHRLRVFAINDAFIERHNKKADLGESTYRVGHNQFSTLNLTEFKALLLNFQQPVPAMPRQIFNAQQQTLDDSVDWTKNNAVTPGSRDEQAQSPLLV